MSWMLNRSYPRLMISACAASRKTSRRVACACGSRVLTKSCSVAPLINRPSVYHTPSVKLGAWHIVRRARKQRVRLDIVTGGDVEHGWRLVSTPNSRDPPARIHRGSKGEPDSSGTRLDRVDISSATGPTAGVGPVR